MLISYKYAKPKAHRPRARGHTRTRTQRDTSWGPSLRPGPRPRRVSSTHSCTQTKGPTRRQDASCPYKQGKSAAQRSNVPATSESALATRLRPQPMAHYRRLHRAPTKAAHAASRHAPLIGARPAPARKPHGKMSSIASPPPSSVSSSSSSPSPVSSASSCASD